MFIRIQLQLTFHLEISIKNVSKTTPKTSNCCLHLWFVAIVVVAIALPSVRKAIVLTNVKQHCQPNCKWISQVAQDVPFILILIVNLKFKSIDSTYVNNFKISSVTNFSIPKLYK